ncbi:uncharacterized protein LOC123013557 [Tribolium madens]|uniref:uncharacterized protein LOC123013557 n=1 Tax=Tribolium madens TaxID=41895 RepID=UPI001CF76736|nr:uncharacterized protein LOC123013557 [Tribolium madens]
MAISKNTVFAIVTVLISSVSTALGKIPTQCQGSGGLKYLWGDALTDSPNCLGPNDTPYPTSAIERSFRSSNAWPGSSRQGRSRKTIDPFITQKALLAAHEYNFDSASIYRAARAANVSPANTCTGTPSRLCKTRYNTTAPMYGVSLTSGQPVTIVQKFPDLLQQVVFEVCESSECDVVRGECTQTYVPYLFLVIPLGPVTLTGQDYVLVESGCVCRPKYASQNNQEASAMASIPRL